LLPLNLPSPPVVFTGGFSLILDPFPLELSVGFLALALELPRAFVVLPLSFPPALVCFTFVFSLPTRVLPVEDGRAGMWMVRNRVHGWWTVDDPSANRSRVHAQINVNCLRQSWHGHDAESDPKSYALEEALHFYLPASSRVLRTRRAKVMHSTCQDRKLLVWNELASWTTIYGPRNRSLLGTAWRGP